VKAIKIPILHREAQLALISTTHKYDAYPY